MVTLATAAAMAQERDRRHITPVDPETNKVLTPPKGISEEEITRFREGDTTSLAELARRDSLKKVYTKYPRLTSLWIGASFSDAILMLFKQSYGSFGLSATLNMWNRIQPAVEMGVGFANSTPDDLNFTYKGKLSPYFKLGVNYNFLFKNVPDYQLFLGARVGYSTFGYDITDVQYSNSYWQEYQTFDIRGERSHALWGELLAGLKVKIAGAWSLGWAVRYHRMFSYKKTEHSRPWFVPGFGARNSNFAFGMSVFYTLPLAPRPSN